MKLCANIQHITQIVNIGNIQIGGNHPVIVQSMTDTDTSDVELTIHQIKALADSGAEIVRVTVDNLEAARAIPRIKNDLIKANYHIPIVGCFHYNGHTLLNAIPDCASALDKYRINPGNVGKDKNFESIINTAIKNNKPIRIGVNWGSLDQNLLAGIMDSASSKNLSSDEIMVEAMVQSALDSAQKAIDLGLPTNMIVLSAKVSKITLLIQIYTALAKKCDYPLHLGLTEAGMGIQGIVSTTIALSTLLQMNIGNTIRASITPAPGEPRANEVLICKEILQNLSLRYFTPSITSCPGCGRTKGDAFRNLTFEINQFMQSISKKHPGSEQLKIAVMGCIVNGPGESKHADIGISLPGKGEDDIAVVFIDGVKAYTIRNNLIDSFKEILVQYIEKKFSH